MIETLDLAVLVSQSHFLGAFGHDAIHLAGEGREFVERRPAGDRVGFVPREIAVLFFELRRELDDRLRQLHRLVGPIGGVETHLFWIAPRAQARSLRDRVPEDDFERDQVVAARVGVEFSVLVGSILDREIGHLREVDRHLPGWLVGVFEVDHRVVGDDAAVVGGDARGFEQREVVRAHRTEAPALLGDGIGHPPPVEDRVGVGEDEPPAAEFVGRRGLLDAKVLDAGHGRGSAAAN